MPGRFLVTFMHRRYAGLIEDAIQLREFALPPGVYRTMSLVVEAESRAEAREIASDDLHGSDAPEFVPIFAQAQAEWVENVRDTDVALSRTPDGPGRFAVVFVHREYEALTRVALRGEPFQLPLRLFRHVSIALEADGRKDAMEAAERALRWPDHEPDMVPLHVLPVSLVAAMARRGHLEEAFA